MRPRLALSLVTTRAPIFFALSQSAALLMLASGAIVATLVPLRLRMLSMVIVSSHRAAWPPVSSRPRNWGACHGNRSAQRGALAYHIGRKPSASLGNRATGQRRTEDAFRGALSFGWRLRIRLLPVSGGAIRRDRCGRGALRPTVPASARRPGRPSIGPRDRSRPRAGRRPPSDSGRRFR